MTMADTIAVMNNGRIEQLGDPATLYENPVTTFVANFLGQSNLVRAKVTSRSGGDLAVDAQGTTFTMPVRRCVSESEDIWVGVRPEKVQVNSPGGGTNNVGGTITDTSYIGVSTQYLVRLPWGQELTVIRQNDGAPIHRPGDQVELSWEPAHTFGLDASQDANAGVEREEDDEPVPAGATS
jgi:spermidine/putrescine transport system ATP-binding protein